MDRLTDGQPANHTIGQLDLHQISTLRTLQSASVFHSFKVENIDVCHILSSKQSSQLMLLPNQPLSSSDALVSYGLLIKLEPHSVKFVYSMMIFYAHDTFLYSMEKGGQRAN